MKPNGTCKIRNAELQPGVNAAFLCVIDRRSREIAEGKVQCRPIKKIVSNIRRKLHAFCTRDK